MLQKIVARPPERPGHAAAKDGPGARACSLLARRAVLRTKVSASLLGYLVLGVPLLAQGGSSASNPVVTFASPGTKQVTLEVCNAAGCDTEVKSVVVLDPMPKIVGMTSIPVRLLMGQSFSFNAQTTGRPPLTHRWLITGLTGNLTLLGNPAVWSTTTPGLGTFLVQLEVQNVDGTVASTPAGVLVVAPGIFSDGFESAGAGAWQAVK